MAQSVEVVVSELYSAAARLENAAQRLTDGLSSVDDETTQLLGTDWKGGAASAYAPAWEKWHGGAEQVVKGLQRMSELLTIAGKEYAKTDESAAGALDSTMQGSGGSAGSGGGGASGGQGASQGPGGADGADAAAAGQSVRSTDGPQQGTSAASQLGQLAGQPLSQAGHVATGLAQAMTGLAQQVTQLVTAAAQQAEARREEAHTEEAASAERDEEQRTETPGGETEDAATAPGDRSAGTAPVDSAPADRSKTPRAVERPGE